MQLFTTKLKTVKMNSVSLSVIDCDSWDSADITNRTHIYTDKHKHIHTHTHTQTHICYISVRWSDLLR